MSNTWLGKAIKKGKTKKMSMGPTYRNYYQGSPIPQPTSPYNNHLVPTLADWTSNTAPNMTATEIALRQQEAYAAMAQSIAMAQQMQAMTRQALVPGAVVYVSNMDAMSITEVQPEPSYETPGWIKDMHTTIDALHAKGI